MFKSEKEKMSVIESWKKTHNLQKAYHDVFLNDNGQKVLYNIAQECGFMKCCTTPDGNPVLSAFNDGKRAAFLYIVERLGLSEREILDIIENVKKEDVV